MFFFFILAFFAFSESAQVSQPTPNAAIAQFIPVIFTKVLPWFAAPVKVNSNANLPEDFLLTDALIKKQGYGYEYYKVTTEDGYILSLHRILSKKPDVTKPPVLIQHGVLASSDSWVIDEKTSLAFTLSDNGYDVWLGDQRGSAYSKGHKYYSVKDYRYWNFTFHEAGLYDIPAFIDKMIEVTGKPQIYYIGHSMGTTVFLAMASLRPEYNDKVKAAILLAPVATTPTLPELYQTLLRLLILYGDSIRDSLSFRKAYEFMPRSGETIKAIRKSCAEDSSSIDFCLDVIGMAYGEHRSNLDRKNIGRFASVLPTGTSINTVHHLSQLYKKGFRLYSHGRLRNMQIYGSFDPPLYPLGDIKTPIALFYGDNDTLMNRRSANELAKSLKNLIINRQVSDPKFTHTDFLFGNNVKEVVNKEVLDLLDSLN